MDTQFGTVCADFLNLYLSCENEFYALYLQPDLLPLIEGPSQNAMSAQQKPEIEEPPDIEVIELWQRTYGGKWVIGISFRNTSNR